MAGMHAPHRILANCARARQPRVAPGEFLKVAPDLCGVIAGVHGAEYDAIHDIDIAETAPQIAQPHTPEDVPRWRARGRPGLYRLVCERLAGQPSAHAPEADAQ